MLNTQPKFKAKKKLKMRRLAVGLKQETMAELIAEMTGKKMSNSRYQKIEQGIYEADLNTVIAVCKCFEDTQIADLWTFTRDVEKV